jgi:hypothetical protein
MAKRIQRDWRDSEFTKHVRVKEEKHEMIKRKKGKKSIAGKLDEIIDFWEHNYENYVE